MLYVIVKTPLAASAVCDLYKHQARWPYRPEDKVLVNACKSHITLTAI